VKPRPRSAKPAHGKAWEKRNNPPPDQPWIWLTREMLESLAWRVLSGPGRRVVDRIMIEHMSHAGTANGNLPVTYGDFVAYGLRRSSIAAALREAEALGWIRVAVRGRGGNAEFRHASRYALAWLPTADGQLCESRWQQIKTQADVENALRATARPRPRRVASLRKAA
jgi:hypothetical protein